MTGETDGQDFKLRVCGGQYQLVFITPELLLENLYWRHPQHNISLKAFVIDEAHCIAK